MRRYSLLHLETLCSIARFGTFRAAAHHLNTTQPAVSARIRELEDAVGLPLFHKRGRRMELTPRGRELVQQVQPLLIDLDEIVVTGANATAATGVVRIGAGEIATQSWFPAFMAELKRRMPRVTCEVVVDLTMGMRQRLENGDLDIALLAGPVHGPQLRQAELGPVTLRWMGAPALPRDQPLDQLFTSVPVWSLARPSAMHDMTIDALARHQVRGVALNTSTQIRALIDLVAAGAGIALLPEVMIDDEIAQGRLRPLAPQVETLQLTFVIAWNAREEQTVTRSIVALAQECSTFRSPVAATGRRRRSGSPRV